MKERKMYNHFFIQFVNGFIFSIINFKSQFCLQYDDTKKLIFDEILQYFKKILTQQIITYKYNSTSTLYIEF